VLLTWDDKRVEVVMRPGSKSTYKVNITGQLKALQVTADGAGIVSHAGLALLRALSDTIRLTAGLSKALARDRLLVHDRARVLADRPAQSPTALR
jgi:hypothetical protein